MVNYFIVVLNGLGCLDISPWVLKALITESIIGIVSTAGILAVYLYPPGGGIIRKRTLS